MAQIIVHGHRESIDRHRTVLSDALRGGVLSALAYPHEKHFHRFVALDPLDFTHPQDPDQDYTIIEISMFEGRSEEAKRDLIEELIVRLEAEVGISPLSVETTITETPRANWGSKASTRLTSHSVTWSTPALQRRRRRRSTARHRGSTGTRARCL